MVCLARGALMPVLLIDFPHAGIRFLFVACACLFVGVQLMFEYRYVAFIDVCVGWYSLLAIGLGRKSYAGVYNVDVKCIESDV